MGKLSNWLHDFCDGDTRLYEMFQKSIIRSNYHEDFAKLTRTSIQGQLREWGKAHRSKDDYICEDNRKNNCEGDMEIDHREPLHIVRDDFLVNFVWDNDRNDIHFNVKGFDSKAEKLEKYRDEWLKFHWMWYATSVDMDNNESLAWLCRKHHAEKTRGENNQHQPNEEVRIAEYLLYRTIHWNFLGTYDEVEGGNGFLRNIRLNCADITSGNTTVLTRQFKFVTLINPGQSAITSVIKQHQERCERCKSMEEKEG